MRNRVEVMHGVNLDQLGRLADLRDAGSLTEAEFAAANAGGLALALRLIPRPAWRRVSR